MPLKELTIEGKRVAQDEIRAACCTATMPDSYGVVAMAVRDDRAVYEW
jgi:hypothetical protein